MIINTDSQLWIIINCDSYSHAHVYFCTPPSSNLFSFVSCDSKDDEDHILWPKWKHISPSAEPNYATAIKSNGGVNGVLYLTAVLHDPLLKAHMPTVLRRRSSDITSHLCSYECSSVRWGNPAAQWVQWDRFVHRLTFPKINDSLLVSCHQRPVAHLWKAHWTFHPNYSFWG